MNWIKLVFNVVNREINWIIKDTDLIIMIFAAPFFYSLFYGSMYINKSEFKVPIGILDMDHSEYSKDFVKDLNASPYIKVKEYLYNSAQIKDKLMNENLQGVVFIPSEFGSDLSHGGSTEIKLYLNTQRFLHSNDLNKAVTQIALSKGEEIRTKIFSSKGYSLDQAAELSTPLKDEVIFLFNPSESYGDFLIPAILILVLQQTLFMGLGQSMAKENEMNKIIDLKLTSGNNLFAAITGKIFFYIILFLSYAFIFFTLDYKIFRLNFEGNFFAFAILTILMLISMSALSVLVGSFFSKKIYALILISFTSYPLFFLAGYSWPTFAMPEFIQIFSHIIPTTSYMQAVNRVATMGTRFNQILPEFFNLLILTLLFGLAGILRIKGLFNKN